MKTFLQTFGLAVALVLFGFFGSARAQDNNATFQTFYDQLGGEGTWIQTNNYGYVWQPQVNDPNWRPYANGHWVYSDQGWTWVSPEPWAWATYHYGRWVDLDGTGWCWVPGYVWAPAWVSWREGDGYCGWAPLPPDTEVGIDFGDGLFLGFDFGYHIGDDCDTAYGIGPGCYSFCPIGDLGAGNYQPYYANRNDNFRLIDRTRNVTNINVGRPGSREAGRFGRVTANGPSLAEINAASRTPVQRVNLAGSSRAGEGLRGQTLGVYAPHINPTTGKTARPRSVAATLRDPSVNRGTDINRPLAVNARVQPAGATPQQVAAARTEQGRGLAGVATAYTRFSRVNDRPFSAMQPLAKSSVVTRQPTAVNSASANDGASAFTGLRSSQHAADVRASNGEGNFTGLEPSHRVPHEAVAPTAPFHSGSSSERFHSMTSFFHGSALEHPPGSMVHHESFASHHEGGFVSHSGGSSFSHFSAAHFSGGGVHLGGGGHPGGGGSHVGGGRPAAAVGGGGKKR
jgi:hypothetical protein